MKNDTITAKLIAEKDSQIAGLMAENARLSQQVEWLMQQFRLAKHRQFGASSEKSAYDQLNLFNEAEATAAANMPEPELVKIEEHYRKRTRLVNDRLPDSLPVETVEHGLPAAECVCPECGGNLHVMGHETMRRELVIIPAQAKIVEHVRSIYACRDCEKGGCSVPIVKAPVDKPVIKGSFASPEAIAHIMTQKFVMGAPLYRQEQDWNRQGIMISRQTMSNWLIKAALDWLEPIYNALWKMLCCCYDILHADETVLQVLREPGKTPQSKSYMWLYRTSRYDPYGKEVRHPIVLYDYQPDRRSKHPAAFLKDFKGFCHTDGYDGYHALPGSITVAGCWGHDRRKWDEALKVLPAKDREGSNALRGKQYCDQLFELERGFTDMQPDERLQKRLEFSKPVLDEFFAWAVSLNVLSKTLLGVAVNYTLSQRKYLEHYLLDGRLEISNNRAERSIKPFVIDRKNFLFCNTPGGARASAIMFSIIETAKENGLDPFAYLTYIFKNAPNWDIRNNSDALNRLLPQSAPDYCMAGKSK